MNNFVLKLLEKPLTEKDGPWRIAQICDSNSCLTLDTSSIKVSSKNIFDLYKFFEKLTW